MAIKIDRIHRDTHPLSIPREPRGNIARGRAVSARNASRWQLHHDRSSSGDHRFTPPLDELLTLDAVLTRIEERTGRTIAASTWRSYVAREQAPAPVRRIARQPLFDPADIDSWIDNRPGRGNWRTGDTQPKQAPSQ